MLQGNNTALKEKIIRFNQEAEERDAQRRAVRAKKPYLNILTTPVEIEALALISESRAKELQMAAINLVNKDLVVAVFDLENEGVKEELKRLEKMGYKPDIFMVSQSGLEHAWSYYRYVTRKAGEVMGSVQLASARIAELKENIKTIRDFQEEVEKLNLETAGIAEFMEVILGGALALKASDIHFEPVKEHTGVRFRIDGVLQEAMGKGGGQIIPTRFYKQVVSRIKLLSGLKLNITDETQDGRFTIELGGTEIEVRVAIAPAEFGEVIVLRLLDPEAISLGLGQLGLSESDRKIVEREIKKPNGLLLNTGPTGSGKTTSLYAFLKEVVTPEVKIITIEDPIEYHLEGIEQTQVNREADYTFASGLRSILRQDPDIVLVGEIRDGETAGIATNASLTGHLVFSTLHTNDAAGAIPRLVDLGVQPALIGASLNLVIAQRLARRVCLKCRRIRKIDGELAKRIATWLDSLPERAEADKYKKIEEIYEAASEGNTCDACGGTGYKGRVGIYELLVVTDKVQAEIEKGLSVLEIRKLADEQGMITMQEDGILKALQGITSLEEVERVTGELQWKRKEKEN